MAGRDSGHLQRGFSSGDSCSRRRPERVARTCRPRFTGTALDEAHGQLQLRAAHRRLLAAVVPGDEGVDRLLHGVRLRRGRSRAVSQYKQVLLLTAEHGGGRGRASVSGGRPGSTASTARLTPTLPSRSGPAAHRGGVALPVGLAALDVRQLAVHVEQHVRLVLNVLGDLGHCWRINCGAAEAV